VVDQQAWGVDPGYYDALGGWHDHPGATVAAVMAAMGAAGTRHPDDQPPGVVSVRLDHPLPPLPPGVLMLEDGATLRCEGTLPADVPTGYHLLRPAGGESPRQLIVSPGRCPSPTGARRWGWSCQLYATRSRRSWGIGDLGDLRRLARWSGRLGAGIALVNPLHAISPGPRPQPSPYFPSSRCFLNPLYLRIEEIPGASDIAEMGELAAAGRALGARRLIERDRVWALKSSALEALFQRFGGARAFDAFCAERGATLHGFATFCALAERHGTPWQAWPSAFRRPGTARVEAFARSRQGARQIRFHQWLQWLLDLQLARASRPVELVFDLAIGVDPGGADAWLWQDCVADGMRVGAPPDEFNTLGQDWGLPPWDPWRLRSGGYRPFVETVRANLRHAGGLRIDHVMGLFRLFWIPVGGAPVDGAYVRYPYWDLLNILALEAERAGAWVVGEDLGTVEDLVREELADRDILSYRLLWFEPDRPAKWPTRALAAVTTHDLPTIAGVWSGSDLDVQRRLGLAPNEKASEGLRRRLVDWTGSDDRCSSAEVVERAHRALGEAACSVVAATLDDALVVEERPNMPGTTDQWPNWSIGLPSMLEEIERSPMVHAIADDLAGRGRSAGPGDGDHGEP
jgi:4-alpha-glucanotransferase